jgi:peptidyl-dipeptidase Dcp
VLAFEAAALKDAGVDFAPVPPRYRTTYFSHSFSAAIRPATTPTCGAKSSTPTRSSGSRKRRPARKNGDHFRKTLLSRGGTADAMDLFRNFRGRDAKSSSRCWSAAA